TDEDLKHLAGFPKLKTLVLRDGQASNAALSYVGKLNTREWLLIVSAHDVVDEGVAHLSKLRKLQCILIANSQITDESFKIFAGMPSLTYLELPENRFTNRGLSYLRDMVQLEVLHLARGDLSGITDEGLVHLEGLANLQSLGL